MSFVPSTFPILSTVRLRLRQLNLYDSDEIFVLRSDASVNQYLGREKAKTLQDAKDFINRINFASDNQPSFFWAICLEGDDKLVGTICLWNFSPQKDKAEIGYELLPQYQGRGIMQEAARKVIEFGFGVLQLSTIEAWTVGENNSSIRLLERNNFIRNSELEKNIDRAVEGPDLVIYTLSKEQFSSSVAL